MHRHFPALAGRTYLDAATIGVGSLEATSAVAEVVTTSLTSPAETGTRHHQALGGLRDRTRDDLAALIGAETADIALVESCTHALGILARALPLQAGDEVLTTDLEFVQIGVLAGSWAATGVRTKLVPHVDGMLRTDDFREQITARTRAILVSSVQWTNGFRLDLESLGHLCAEHGIWLIVDAAQHIGALPFDVRRTPVDALASSGHKWLNAPFGMGFLYLSPGLRERLELPPVPGFFASTPPGVAATWGEAFTTHAARPIMEFDFTREARAWEIGGTANFAGAVGLGAAVRLVSEVGIERIGEHCLALGGLLADGLSREGTTVVSPLHHGSRSAITTFTLGSPELDNAMCRRLADAGIATSVRYVSGVGGIRVSCHVFNTTEDVECLIAAVGGWEQDASA